MPAKKASSSTPPKNTKKDDHDKDVEQPAPGKVTGSGLDAIRNRLKKPVAPKRKHEIPEDAEDADGVKSDADATDDENENDDDDADKAKKKKKRIPGNALQPASDDDEEGGRPAKKKAKKEEVKPKGATKASSGHPKKVKKIQDDDDGNEDVREDAADDSERKVMAKLTAKKAQAVASEKTSDEYRKYFEARLSGFVNGPKKVLKLFPFGVSTHASKKPKDAEETEHVLHVLFDPENPKNGYVGLVDFMSSFLSYSLDVARVKEMKFREDRADVYKRCVVAALVPNGYEEFGVNTFLSLDSALKLVGAGLIAAPRKPMLPAIWETLSRAALVLQAYDPEEEIDDVFVEYGMVKCGRVVDDPVAVKAAIKHGVSAKEYVDGLPYPISNAFRAEQKAAKKPPSKPLPKAATTGLEEQNSEVKGKDVKKPLSNSKLDEKKQSAVSKSNEVAPAAAIPKKETPSKTAAATGSTKMAKTMNASNGVAPASNTPLKPMTVVNGDNITKSAKDAKDAKGVNDAKAVSATRIAAAAEKKAAEKKAADIVAAEAAEKKAAEKKAADMVAVAEAAAAAEAADAEKKATAEVERVTEDGITEVPTESGASASVGDMDIPAEETAADVATEQSETPAAAAESNATQTDD